MRERGGYTVDGVKAWITHGGAADFYALFARTAGTRGPGRAQGISCLHVPAGVPGVSAAPPERKMGMRASVTTQMIFEGARVPADHLIGAEGAGFKIALAALDAGRLGIAACSTGLAQAALDVAVGYAQAAAAVRQADHRVRRLVVHARRHGDGGGGRPRAVPRGGPAQGRRAPVRTQAAMAKLFASDTAMRVATDAVQVLGGYGYVADFPAERYLREAKMLQIVEGTNQIQRLVIGRALAREG